MRNIRLISLLAPLLAPAVAPRAQEPAPEPVTPPASAPAPASADARPKLDDGRLDPAWFSPEKLEFRHAGDYDYFWVRPGFSIEGRTLQFLPWPVTPLPADRDEKDREAARKIQAGLPDQVTAAFAKRLAGRIRVVEADGDLVVHARLVDCNGGNSIGFVMPHATFEMKFIDRDGVLQVAIHTRLIGRALKITYGAWGTLLAQPFVKGVEAMWKNGKPADS